MENRTIAVISLWIVFGVTLVRAVCRRSGGGDPVDVRIWGMFLLSVLAFTFWGEAAEAALDQYFHQLPVALYLKYVCLISVCHLYHQLLRQVGGLPRQRTGLDYLAPAAVGLGLLSFVLNAIYVPLPKAELRYIVIGARDMVVSVFILWGFLRGTLVMWQQERVLAMRLKQTALLLFFVCFLITALGSVSAAVMTLLRQGDAALAAGFLQPFLYPAVMFFALTLVPYRWYSGLLHLQRLCTYYRLKCMERWLARRVGTQPNQHQVRVWWLQSAALELAIYRTVISILDEYPLLRDVSRQDFVRLHRCVLQHREYNDLVNALAAYRP